MRTVGRRARVWTTQPYHCTVAESQLECDVEQPRERLWCEERERHKRKEEGRKFSITSPQWLHMQGRLITWPWPQSTAASRRSNQRWNRERFKVSDPSRGLGVECGPEATRGSSSCYSMPTRTAAAVSMMWQIVLRQTARPKEGEIRGCSSESQSPAFRS